jgi:hypothetical protein
MVQLDETPVGGAELLVRYAGLEPENLVGVGAAQGSGG